MFNNLQINLSEKKNTHQMLIRVLGVELKQLDMKYLRTFLQSRSNQSDLCQREEDRGSLERKNTPESYCLESVVVFVGKLVK